MVPSDRYIYFAFEEQDVDLPIINKVRVIACANENISCLCMYQALRDILFPLRPLTPPLHPPPLPLPPPPPPPLKPL